MNSRQSVPFALRGGNGLLHADAGDLELSERQSKILPHEEGCGDRARFTGLPRGLLCQSAGAGAESAGTIQFAASEREAGALDYRLGRGGRTIGTLQALGG